MCLYIRDIQKQVATEPIKVYKLLEIDNTPPFYPADAYHVGVNKPKTQTYTPTTATEDKYWVGAGYLHAYTDKERAISAAKGIWFRETDKSRTIQFKIVEMYIPEGTAYYWDQNVRETAAEVLEWRPDSQVEIVEVEARRSLTEKPTLMKTCHFKETINKQ